MPPLLLKDVDAAGNLTDTMQLLPAAALGRLDVEVDLN